MLGGVERKTTFDFLNSAARHRAKETRAKKIEEKGENPYRFRVSIYMGTVVLAG